MANAIEKVLAIAESEVGYLEKASNTMLDDKQANAGVANFTKYARDLFPSLQGQPWCDMFCDWVFYKAFGDKAKEILCGGYNAYTPSSAQYYKNKGRWYTTPQVGDQIFFKNSQRICHTGIVYKVDSTHVFTIEGNTSAGSTVIPNGGAVCKKSYTLNNSSIAGYGRPMYELVENINTSSTNLTPERVIDVSSYQGLIDWNKVKASGINKAILRGILKSGNLDTMFETNYTNARKAGVEIIGVYHYSYSMNAEQSIKAAQTMIAALKGRKIPIYLDLEEQSQGILGKEVVTIIAKTYVIVCQQAGYECNIYSNLNWYQYKYKPEELKSLGCKFWIARYGKSSRPNVGEYIWQYTSQGIIPGINGYVDVNYLYPPTSIVSKSQSQNPPITISKPKQVAPVVSPCDVLLKISATSLNVRSYPVDGNVLKTYKQNQIVHANGMTKDGWYYNQDGYFSSKYAPIAMGVVFNCNKLNFRKDANKNSPILDVLIQGTVVTMMNIVGDWYRVLHQNQIGYVSSKYITIK